MTAIVGNTDQLLHITVADTWLLRFRGLLGRPSPATSEGLLITRCKAVHTLGMAYPIDVVYLDRDYRVVAVAHSIRQGCFKVPSPSRRTGVTQVLELADREASRLGLQPGVQLYAASASGLVVIKGKTVHAVTRRLGQRIAAMRHRRAQAHLAAIVEDAWRKEASDIHLIASNGRAAITQRFEKGRTP
ncbi:MAG: DUF192 domain-containing protein [Rhodanobacter sp.]